MTSDVRSDAGSAKRFNGTVVLVEDNDDNRIIYSTMLEHGGYRVFCVGDGKSGVELVRKVRPSVVLMDISVPVMDGWDATRILKSDPATRNIPIVALTAHALASDREKAKEVGCDDYIAKPAEPRAVLDAVEKWAGKTK